jgi:hypothetical protein
MIQTDPMPDPGTVYEDDLAIGDDERIFRKIRAGSFRSYGDGSVTGIKSDAFQDASVRMTQQFGYPAVAMSVHVESIMQLHNIPPEALLAGESVDWGLAVLTVGEIRNEGQGIVLKPEPDLPAHALVFAKQGSRKNGRIRKNLARLAAVILEPRIEHS